MRAKKDKGSSKNGRLSVKQNERKERKVKENKITAT